MTCIHLGWPKYDVTVGLDVKATVFSVLESQHLPTSLLAELHLIEETTFFVVERFSCFLSGRLPSDDGGQRLAGSLWLLLRCAG